MYKIGFIGMGNMGRAMLGGVLKKFNSSDIAFSDVNEERMEKIKKETGVDFYLTNSELANNCKYIVLAVKPQYIDVVLDNIKNIITKDNVLVSIVAGIKIEYIKSKFDINVRTVRAMPNTPALVGCGMTGVTFNNAELSFEEKDTINILFSSIGKCKVVPESLMSVITCASGSSPAYVYMFIEALADSAVKYGMTRNDAYEFVAQTVLGSAKMVLDTHMHPAQLKDMVCSPAGTTICGVAALEENGFRNAIIKATDACFEKSENIK